jgi:diphthamide biosynthesis protein 2
MGLAEDRVLEDTILSATSQWHAARPAAVSAGTCIAVTGDADECSDAGDEQRRVLRSYDVVATARALSARGSRRIALQFPDSLLPDSFLVCAAVEEGLRLCAAGGTARDDGAPLVFVLGDTSYGECCVDELAAQHLDADVVVHYGNACLSRTRALPVLYVFPQQHKLPALARSMAGARARLRAHIAHALEQSPDAQRVVVLFDIELCSYVRDIAVGLGEPSPFDRQVTLAAPRVDVSQIVEPSGDVDASKLSRPGGTAADVWCPPARPGADAAGDVREEGEENGATCGPLTFPAAAGGDGESHTAFLWVTLGASGVDENVPLRNAALKYSPASCAGLYLSHLAHGGDGGDGGDAGPKAVNASRLLGRRYALMERARSAERVGIVAGTLGVSGNLAIIERVKRAVEAAGRRWYMLLVGRPTAAKLGNFAEMDVFVLVACAQNALIDCRDHLRPVVTPLELEVALGARDWFTDAYSADFADVLRLPPPACARADTDGDDEDTRAGLAVAARDAWSVSVGGGGGAAQFLATLSWTGLDAGRGGDGTPLAALGTRAAVGASGVAGAYEGEGGGGGGGGGGESRGS